MKYYIIQRPSSWTSPRDFYEFYEAWRAGAFERKGERFTSEQEAKDAITNPVKWYSYPKNRAIIVSEEELSMLILEARAADALGEYS